MQNLHILDSYKVALLSIGVQITNSYKTLNWDTTKEPLLAMEMTKQVSPFSDFTMKSEPTQMVHKFKYL